MNNVNIIGNITRDIELQYLQSGTAVAKFGIAYNSKRKNAQGGYDDKANFFEVVAFGKTAETVNQYFRKGSKIGITGELQYEQWEDQQNQKRSRVSILLQNLTFIDKKDDQQQQPQQQQPQQQAQSGYRQPQQQQPQSSYNAPQQQQQQQQYQQPNQQPVAEDNIPF